MSNAEAIVAKDGTALASRRIVVILCVLLLSAVTWAYFTQVEEITRGEGRVIPASRTQLVQATEPGVVKDIAVRIGETVKAGDLIIRLDDTVSTSDLGEVQAKLRALRAKVARLSVEGAGDTVEAFVCPQTVASSAPQICENEISLMETRRNAFRSTRGVLEQRLLQRQKELDETRADLARLKGNLVISERELEMLAPMAEKRLIAQTELIRVQQQVNDYQGQINVLEESIPRIEGAIAEARFQLEELDLKFRQEALTEKTAALAELSVLEQSERGQSNRVERTDIRSPVDGIINALEVNTVGSFVNAGDQVAEVVPTSDELLVEARISPKDVAFVVPGQEALVKISAFDFSIYGGLEGEVVNVSSDSFVEERTGEPYFEVRVRTRKAYLERNGRRFMITPGMVCTVDILTGQKTILQYLLKPVNKAREEAFTER
ncbi:HlyD family type I secretion periplasmic adaptor subunit [Roseibium sp. DSM 29163]|uniref:Membrane fusion protein (MFP) family protein n=2 Tax=Roseibium salinum TaxID=1604349 RepID=A0ABT3R4G5_9HYPH|nr:HlyD family type I secretion periplasmic adaptor subunit [Roseibium sp. DSM 29163]